MSVWILVAFSLVLVALAVVYMVADAAQCREARADVMGRR